MQPISGNQRPGPDLLTYLLEVSLVLCLPHKMHPGRSPSNIPRLLLFFLNLLQTLTFGSLFARCRIHCACHQKSRLDILKWPQHAASLTVWLRHVLRATAARTLCEYNTTSKSAPMLRCFWHCDFKTCFMPQPRAHFQPLNFQRCSAAKMLLTCWLRHVLRTHSQSI